MNTLTSTSLCNYQVSRFPSNISNHRNISAIRTSFPSTICFKVYANTNELEAEPKQELEAQPKEATKSSSKSATAPLDQDLKKVGFLNSTGVLGIPLCVL